MDNEQKKYHIGSRLCKTMDVSLGNGLFAGRLLEWVAESGSIFAMKIAETHEHMALYRLDNLRITKSIKVGQLIDFYAENVTFGNTSVSFNINGYFTNGDQFLISECTYVQVDDCGGKIILKRNRK